MQFCNDHWDRLRSEIDRVGLSALVPDSSEAAMRALASDLEEGSTIDNFDPLMRAHMAILNNAMDVCEENGGAQSVLEMMGLFGTEWCPICYLNAQHEQACQEAGCEFSFDNWVTFAAEDQLKEWKAFSE